MRSRPKGFWPENILKAIQSFGGKAWLVDVYDWIEDNVSLTNRELDTSPHQGRPYYVNTVRGIASDMVNRGALVRVQPGLYKLP